jgi:hypothetical protein
MPAHSEWIHYVVPVLIWMAATSACHRSSDSAANDGGTSQTDVGIPECDSYLSKYRKCIEDKVPGDSKKAMQDALDRTRSTWKTLAANAGARPGLPQACSLAQQTAQTMMKQYACAW